METIKQIKSKIFMQYAIEHLIECYDKAQTESDRYYVKLELLDFIENYDVNLPKLLDYMDLQPDKFEPFIKTIESIKLEPKQKKRAKALQQIESFPEVKIYMFNQGE